jgi:hypothetical protein
MAASRRGPREYRLLKAERDGEPDEQQEMFWKEVGTLGSGSASHFDGLTLPMLPALARSLNSTTECRTPFRKVLQFIVIAVMSVISGTFPYTNGVFP